MEKGCLTMHKWASNDPRLIKNCPNKTSNKLTFLDVSNNMKTLGISWISSNYTIAYAVSTTARLDKITKRNILSINASLFDPLGLLCPVIVKAKLVMQLLWKLQITWDEDVPSDIKIMWLEFENQLRVLKNLSFKRCLIISDCLETQLHGFCDASESAYGACIYLRTTSKQGQHSTILVCSKSRVAPIHPLNLPWLELCAALFLARLFATCAEALKHMTFSKTYFWSDSTTALHCIMTQPHKLKTFVSNRVAEIQEITQTHEWRHVPTQDNPADLASQGRMTKVFK